ncbi:MAG TPA: flagellar motor switch protein FliN [Ruminiclostridium sp.]|nr:flagellar motor switch protein FliN [Ruminiclostridium sp.]
MDDNQNETVKELSQQDKDIIGEVSNISMGSAATALSNIMGKKVVITSPTVEIGTTESISNIDRVPSLGVIISYTEGIVGKDILIIRKSDAIEIVKALMGADMVGEEFGEIEISAIAEVMNQMMGSSATALSNFLGRAVNISPPSAFMLTEENRMEKLNFIYEQANNVILVRFLFKVEDVLESDLYMIMTREFAAELVDAMLKNLGLSAEPQDSGEAAVLPEQPQAQQELPEQQSPQYAPQEPQYAPQEPQYAPQEQPTPQYAPPEQQAPQYAPPVQPTPQYAPPVQPTPQYAPPVQPAPQYSPYQQTPPQYYNPAPAQTAAAAAVMPMSQVKPVQLASFDSQPPLGPAEKSNFDLIQDVPLELSVEVGKAHKLVKEVIDFTVGSIIELDKQAGDPVDVIVNGQLIAHGEVVVIDESFGVRITEIIDPKNNGK